MDYISPYLMNREDKVPSFHTSREWHSASDVINDNTLSLSEKHHALDKLEHDALAALTMADDTTHLSDAKSPARLLEEVIEAKRSLYHAS